MRIAAPALGALALAGCYSYAVSPEQCAGLRDDGGSARADDCLKCLAHNGWMRKIEDPADLAHANWSCVQTTSDADDCRRFARPEARALCQRCISEGAGYYDAAAAPDGSCVSGASGWDRNKCHYSGRNVVCD